MLKSQDFTRAGSRSWPRLAWAVQNVSWVRSSASPDDRTADRRSGTGPRNRAAPAPRRRSKGARAVHYVVRTGMTMIVLVYSAGAAIVSDYCPKLRTDFCKTGKETSIMGE